MSDRLTAAIRTAVQAWIVSALTAVASWLLRFEIVIGDVMIENVAVVVAGLVAAVAVGVVNWVLLRLQERWPWIGTIVSLGRSTSTPSYR